MFNKTYFPTDASVRTVLALRCNSIMQHNTTLLAYADNRADIAIVADIVADISRTSDILVNFMGFGSITGNDIAWVLEACDRMDLYTSTAQARDTEEKFLQIKEGK